MLRNLILSVLSLTLISLSFLSFARLPGFYPPMVINERAPMNWKIDGNGQYGKFDHCRKKGYSPGNYCLKLEKGASISAKFTLNKASAIKYLRYERMQYITKDFNSASKWNIEYSLDDGGSWTNLTTWDRVNGQWVLIATSKHTLPSMPDGQEVIIRIKNNASKSKEKLFLGEGRFEFIFNVSETEAGSYPRL